jgi:hypothetical protein
MQDAINELEEKLSLALGRAVWAFARVELESYNYLRLLARDSIDRFMANHSLSARLKVVRELIKRLPGNESEKAKALECWSRAERLSRTRNIIAHNPWRISLDFEAKGFRSEIWTSWAEKGNLDLPRLEAFAEETAGLAAELQQLLGKLAPNRDD